jgi:sphingolipid delta-4 desaturase
MPLPEKAPESGLGFSVSNLPEPHRSRTRSILRDHPEVRRYIGKTPGTFWIMVGAVALQIGLAFALRDSRWWLIVATAALVGAFANHALWVVIHECTHNLIFKTPGADIPNAWEARLVGTSPWRKAIWLLLFPLVQSTRPPRLREIRPIDRWVVLNLVVQAGFDVAVWFVLGPKAFAYLFIAFFFSVGLHPLGARWVQEHYLLFQGQETTSYYGWLNRLALNVGYHNEHHDFPSIPWNHLPDLKRTAPEAYDTLGSHASWSKLLWQFLFDRRVSLFARQVRQDRGGVELDNAATPDVELIERGDAPSADPVAGGPSAATRS